MMEIELYIKLELRRAIFSILKLTLTIKELLLTLIRHSLFFDIDKFINIRTDKNV